MRAAILIWVWTFLSRNPDFKNADEIRRVAAYTPLRSILVETDAPYLAPMPFRGKRNEPCFVVKTLEALASVRGIPLSARLRPPPKTRRNGSRCST